MKYLIFLLLPLTSLAQTQAINIDLNWTHDGLKTEGYRVYKGKTPTTLLKLIDTPKTTRLYNFNQSDTLPICFGISAFNQFGESEIVTKLDDGSDLCLGKPNAPTKFTFQVR